MSVVSPHQWLAIAPLAISIGLLPSTVAHAHGSMVKPQSRIYTCTQGNRENPTDPACAAAKAVAGPQLFYDWMGINQANANGNHKSIIPDGKLCSGNNPTFRGLDLPRSDWQATTIAPEANGRYGFRFRATAAHATRDWVFYVTREGWNPTTPLRWSDLEQFCTVGNTPVQADGTYHLDCPLPKRSGRHVIYNTWQRSDSTEAFYTCMDVQFSGNSGAPAAPNPTAWRDVGALTVQNALQTGTAVTLRVFNANGNDVERIDTTLPAGQTSTTAWPLQVAKTVNATAKYARIGVLANGVVTPVASASQNRVYLSGTGQRHQVDIRLPEPAPSTGDYDHVYPAGIGQYVPGQTTVKGSDGKLYACKPAPEGKWCNINHASYRPGTGSAWRDAWVLY